MFITHLGDSSMGTLYAIGIHSKGLHKRSEMVEVPWVTAVSTLITKSTAALTHMKAQLKYVGKKLEI